jgi:hypothetical protein
MFRRFRAIRVTARRLAAQEHAAGQKIRRLTLFERLGKTPDSGTSRQLVTNSSRYGLTKGSYTAEHLELTDLGRTATSPDAPAADRLRARFVLAIDTQKPFKSLYEKFKGRLPAQAVLRDHLIDEGYDMSEINECVDNFILNAKFLGLLKTVAGAERLLPIDHVLEELPPSSRIGPYETPLLAAVAGDATGAPATADGVGWDSICFYITPIGDAGSEERKHSDLFLNSIVSPAMEELELTVIRADQIGKAGMITAQVVEHVIRSRLVIADLSFLNPNVFYELSIRHACKLPAVQLIRAADRIPFDLDQFRTVRIDTTDIYTLVPKSDVIRAEIATHARRAIDEGENAENPLTVFCPGLQVTVPSFNGSVAVAA